MKRIELEKELLGTSEEYQEVMQAIKDSDKKYSDAAIQGAVARLEAINKEKEALQQMESLQQSIAETIGDGFMSMVDGTKTVKEAFRDMARDIIKQLYEVLVIQRLVNGVKGILGGSGLFADGGAFSAGRQIQAYANGGVVGGPTYFPMSGGKTGLMGEAGPEAIMPLKRGKGGKLGVSVEGGSGSVNVVNNINVTGGSDPAAIRAEVAKLMPQITSATKSAVIDARRRGGQMKSAFQ
jgi:phage-related minor tail protein